MIKFIKKIIKLLKFKQNTKIANMNINLPDEITELEINVEELSIVRLNNEIIWTKESGFIENENTRNIRKNKNSQSRRIEII